jgi:hypothetical protein
MRENILKIKKKTQFNKKFNKVVKQKDKKDITARRNKKVGRILDEYERQNQEIRERLTEETNLIGAERSTTR